MRVKKRLMLLGLCLLATAGFVGWRGAVRPENTATSTQSAARAVVHGVSLRIELATTSTEREQGLSGRAAVPENYGMLFVFPEPGKYGFWMKDMRVPLDLFWLDSKGHVVTLQSDVATDTYPHVFEPVAPALYVLETRAGFARAHAIATGTVVDLKNIPSVSS